MSPDLMEWEEPEDDGEASVECNPVGDITPLQKQGTTTDKVEAAVKEVVE